VEPGPIVFHGFEITRAEVEGRLKVLTMSALASFSCVDLFVICLDFCRLSQKREICFQSSQMKEAGSNKQHCLEKEMSAGTSPTVGGKGRCLLERIGDGRELTRAITITIAGVLSIRANVPLPRGATRKRDLVIKWLDDNFDGLSPFAPLINLAVSTEEMHQPTEVPVRRWRPLPLKTRDIQKCFVWQNKNTDLLIWSTHKPELFYILSGIPTTFVPFSQL
jgi:hypothetical protein